MIKENRAGLFREDLKAAEVIIIGQKFGIEAKYINGTKEVLNRVFDSRTEAQQEIDETLKAKI